MSKVYKKIIILGEEFFYAPTYDTEGGLYGTEFFRELETHTVRKYLFFGPKISWQTPKTIFEVDFFIEDIRYTKEEVRSKLERKVKLLNRAEQIKKGEII